MNIAANAALVDVLIVEDVLVFVVDDVECII